jgi:hypothetical protein
MLPKQALYQRYNPVRILFSLFVETGPHCSAQVDLELTIFLSQLPQCWDYRPALWLLTMDSTFLLQLSLFLTV